MTGDVVGDEPPLDAAQTAPVERLLRDLRAGRAGLSGREAARRLLVYGPNELRRTARAGWATELARQLTHPLALLLWVAAGLAVVSGSSALAVGIVVVIVLNAVFAFAQEQQAERAVEALERYLPQRAVVLRDGLPHDVDARDVVPGDILVLAEGGRVSADARLIDGTVEVDLSTLTGESVPLVRAAGEPDARVPLLQARDMVFSGTVCTAGEATGLVVATGMRTELGRIAALSQRVRREESPLERQVKRVAWLIALVAVTVGLMFVPLGILAAGLSAHDAVVFAIGLIVANVPEGLLPTITLALAIGVRSLARAAAVVKRLSAVETLGCATVICTDKTGTLTENRMRVDRLWTLAGGIELGGPEPEPSRWAAGPLGVATAEVMARCNNANVDGDAEGDPTELAMLRAAAIQGAEVDFTARVQQRRASFRFDPARRLMSTVDDMDGDLWVHCKGAPEAVVPRCRQVLVDDGDVRALAAEDARAITAETDALASLGLRVLALGRRSVDAIPGDRDEAEQAMCFLGLVALLDPPRAEIPDAVARCRTAGVRIVVISGDAPQTVAAVARQVGIVGADPRIVTDDELATMSEPAFDALLRDESDLVFARSSPETKLRITDALRAGGHVVAMTGDGVNDAPALRRADIGIAMGRSGTDVAREASIMVLTDDNFASIVAAIEAGRRVYDNVRKFIVYIFAHLTPEAIPFLVFAISGGSVPLPLTVMQILAIDLGTETLPALALGREAAEPGIMERPPRPRREGVIRPAMLVRAWLFLGVISAGLVLAGYFWVLTRAGWHPGNPVDAGADLHHAYLRATTMTFAGIVACQVGTAFAARTEHASLRQLGPLSNRLLLWGIAFELAFAAAVIYAPPLQHVFNTTALDVIDLAPLAAFPPIVWGADEFWRWHRRRRGSQNMAGSISVLSISSG